MKLSKWLNKNGITYTEFSRRTGITRRIISLWADGNPPSSLDVAKRIMEITGGEVTLDDLCTTSPKKRKEM